MEDLPLHVIGTEDLEEESLEIELMDLDDLLEEQYSLKEELDSRLVSFNNGLESLALLEEYHSYIYNKEEVALEDVKQFNLLLSNNTNYALEGIADMIVVGGAITDVARATVGAVVKAVDLAKAILDKINEAIISLASDYETISKLIEKRWFGFNQLLEVYDQQVNKLEDKIAKVTRDSSSLRASFKIKLTTATLDRTKVTNKQSYLRVIENDINGICNFINNYIKQIKIIEAIGSDLNKSLVFVRPYKATLAKTYNIVNLDILNNLKDSSLFRDAAKLETGIASRTLIGGRQVIISTNEDRLELHHKRTEVKAAIRKLNIEAPRVKANDNIYVDLVELNDFTAREAADLLELLRTTNQTLKNYVEQGIPKLLKDREYFSRITQTVTGLGTTITAFTITKKFLSNAGNLEIVKQSLPGKLLSVIDLFLKAASLSALIGLVGAKTAGLLIDWLRKFIISNIFTSMDLQYRITAIMNNVDSQVLDTLVSVRGQCYRVTNRLSSYKVWT
jgi:hypothetical protein